MSLLRYTNRPITGRDISSTYTRQTSALSQRYKRTTLPRVANPQLGFNTSTTTNTLSQPCNLALPSPLRRTSSLQPHHKLPPPIPTLLCVGCPVFRTNSKKEEGGRSMESGERNTSQRDKPRWQGILPWWYRIQSPSIKIHKQKGAYARERRDKKSKR